MVVSHKKICGILTEMGVQDGKIREVVIGVGLNVNLKEIQDELKDKATSLYLETGKTYDRNRLIGLVMEKFEINYEKFVQTCDLSMMLDDYNMLLANKSQPVRVLERSVRMKAWLWKSIKMEHFWCVCRAERFVKCAPEKCL